jgi:ribosomal protein L17
MPKKSVKTLSSRSFTTSRLKKIARLKMEVEHLVQNLRNKDPNTRRKAAAALGNIKDQRSVTSLIHALKDESRYVRRTGSGSL